MIRKLSLVFSILNAIVLLVVITVVLPDTVPTHYNFQGVADAWGSKWIYAVFALIPIVLSVTYLLYRKKPNPNRAVEDKLIPVLPFVFIVICWLMLPFNPESGRQDMRIQCSVIGLLGILMIFLANYMGKVRQNRHLGLRVPWTLKNETVWKKTHRLSGFTGTAGGLCMLCGCILGICMPDIAFIWCMIGLLSGIVLVALVPTVYSWLLYRKLKNENRL